MRNGVRVIGLQLLLLLVIAAVHISSPRPVLACGCCACDFGGGDVACGDGDVDCGGCIVLGGVPASACDACSDDMSCNGQTLCAGDPQVCSADTTGGCCVPPIRNLTPGGCFIVTAAACAELGATYRGDNTDCTAPCVSAAPAPAMSPAGIVVAALTLLAIGAIRVAGRRERHQRLP
jgi:hypothetical protein